MDKKTFTTSKGIVLEIVPITFLLDALHASHRPPEKPKYNAKTAGGVEEWIEITEQDLTEHPDQFTPEQHAEYNRYRIDLALYHRKLNEDETKLILSRGVNVELPTDDKWVKRQKKLGIDVPSDPDDLKIHYITTECFGSTDDMKLLALDVWRESEVSEEVIASVEALFRHSLRRRERSATEQTEHSGREVVGDAKVSGGAGSVQNGKKSKRV